MGWSSGSLSFSNLAWYKKCPQSFYRSMNGEEQTKTKVVSDAADFGIKTEKIWDTAFQENWFKLTESQATYKVLFELSTWNTKDTNKFMVGFKKCWNKIKSVVGDSYVPHLQPSYNIPITDKKGGFAFTLSGKFDYLVYVNGQPIILDCKGTSKKDDKGEHRDQMLHYCFMHYQVKKELAKAYLFYARLGHVVAFNFTLDDIRQYGMQILQYIKEIKGRDLDLAQFEPILGGHCFICGYYKVCPAKQQQNGDKLSQQLNESSITEGILIL